MDLIKVKEQISKNRELLRNDYKVKNIGVFGSFAKSSNTEQSDIDLLVELSEPIGMFRFIELEEYLTKILNRKVDLVTKKGLKNQIKEDILKDTVYVQ